MGMSTNMYGTRDNKGKTLSLDTKNKMNTLIKLDTRSKHSESREKNLKIALDELDRLTARLYLPYKIKEKSAIQYRRSLKEDLIRGRSIEAFVAAYVYCQCRLEKIPRSLKEIALESTRDYHEVARTYRLLLKEHRIKTPIDDPVKYVPKIASRLGKGYRSRKTL